MNFTEEHFDRLCLIVGQLLEGPDIYRDNLDFLDQNDIEFLEEIAIYAEELEFPDGLPDEWEPHRTSHKQDKSIEDSYEADFNFDVLESEDEL